MASTPQSQKNGKTKGLVQNEGTIASRLRSSSKVEGNSHILLYLNETDI
jgi:hypothetical protein